MSAARVELAAAGESAADKAATVTAWPLKARERGNLTTTLDWHFTQLGSPEVAAKDLLRLVTGAYIADRAGRQPAQTVTRSLAVTAHVEDPTHWTVDALEQLADLLHWLTGDDWALRCVASTAPAATPDALPLAVTAADDVCLLSGGLDSYCGALLRLREPGTPIFLGHADTSTAVRQAQQNLEQRLLAHTPPAHYLQHRLHPTVRVNRTPKTRSLLFMAMAVAAASGLGARRVLVAENGFTSINPPLEPSRAGVMTTRSTHPWTFHQLARLLDTIGLGAIQVLNPHANLTKGELVRAALHGNPHDLTIAASTVSCAKLNAGRPRGGSPNLQCGACVACLVRRGAFHAAGITDPTPYAITSPSSRLRNDVRRLRRHDIAARDRATTGGIPEHRILGTALWPPDTNFDAVLDLCRRGLQEISNVVV